jgi:hypothetical protein
MSEFENTDDIKDRRIRLKALIKLGKARGNLSVKEIIDHLPEKLVEDDNLKIVTDMLTDMGIKISHGSDAKDDHEIKTHHPEEQIDNVKNKISVLKIRKFKNQKSINTCSTCHYWIRAVHHEELFENFGCCHKNPPVFFDHPLSKSSTKIMHSHQVLIGKFPYTSYDNWCGQYEYNKLIENDFLLAEIDFKKNKVVISNEVEYEINPDLMKANVELLASLGILTIGDWLTIRKFEQMSIADIGLSAISVINASINLFLRSELSVD